VRNVGKSARAFRKPFTDDEVARKFDSLAARDMTDDGVSQTRGGVLARKLGSARELTDLMRPGARTQASLAGYWLATAYATQA
jgi:hypothetical protein